MSEIKNYIYDARIGYFSMEIALQSDIPTYSGGLGVLAGDTLRSAADLGLPMVGVTLVSHAGYFKQTIDSTGHQQELADTWKCADHATPLHAKVAVTLDERTVWIGVWLYLVHGQMHGEQPVLLLDTDLPENQPDDRELTHYLYGGDVEYRLKQEVILGIGGMRILQALGFTIRRYHMNEGHSALLGLELLRRHAHSGDNLRPGESPYDIPEMRQQCCFTTHTPVEAGHDRFPYDLVRRILRDFEDMAILKHLGGENMLNLTLLALNLSEHVNGVAKRHAEISNRMFPGYKVRAITNGVHPFTWTCRHFADLYDQYLPGWCHEPELLLKAECCIPDAAIVTAHRNARLQLLERIKATTGRALDPKLPLLGFARRMTAYKRPALLFSDIEKLKEIARKTPFYIVMAGKAHPHDSGGKQLIADLHALAQQLDGLIPLVFLPDYNMDMALDLVSGVDVWLNTPLRPMEASGTSGMKAAFNGVPNLSVLDGWWIEGCIEGVTGWTVGDGEEPRDIDDAQSLYKKLGEVVLPLYYRDDHAAWIKVMKGAISKNASIFNTHRMMRRYATEVYS